MAAGNQLVLMKKGRERSDEDECPICSLLSPLDWNQSSFKACCMKEVCDGCILAARKRGMEDCPFCRAHLPEEDGQIISMIERRVDSGDPVAIWHLGGQYHDGQHGLEKDVARAVELWERAAELGVKEAHHNLGCLYDQGMGVEKDTAKMIQHWEAAAMRGHVGARFNIGNKEFGAGNYDIALQHWAIAAKLGEEHALGNVRWLFKEGLATKTVYAEALRGYQGAIKEMSSPDRDAAKALGD